MIEQTIQRITQKITQKIPQSQAAYIEGRRTTEHVFSLKVLAENQSTLERD